VASPHGHGIQFLCRHTGSFRRFGLQYFLCLFFPKLRTPPRGLSRKVRFILFSSITASPGGYLFVFNFVIMGHAPLPKIREIIPAHGDPPRFSWFQANGCPKSLFFFFFPTLCPMSCSANYSVQSYDERWPLFPPCSWTQPGSSFVIFFPLPFDRYSFNPCFSLRRRSIFQNKKEGAFLRALGFLFFFPLG